MSDGLEPLLRHLADGARHSGADLSGRLGITRAATWKRIEALRTLGLNIDGSADGYQLIRPVQWLDGERIRQALTDPSLALDVLFLVDSTNAHLSARPAGSTFPAAVIAEGQKAGRGRRGRGWRSPPGRGIYLSMAWRFQSGLTGLAALSLVIGIAAAKALHSLGFEATKLKWPNDLMVDGRKLGGCLVEINGSAEGPCEAIIGLGINVDLGDIDTIDQPWTDLKREGVNMDRNDLTAALINSMSAHATRFDQHGFAEFLPRWRDLDELAGNRISIQQADGRTLEGLADGIDAQGRLQLVGKDGKQWISSGEISVRAV
jgi:BirA family biotin operon repressor/biotin-[acetyl-CoA-carboxylase] ligase